MKSYIIGLMTALLLAVSAQSEAAPKRIKGSGQIASKPIHVEQFEGISASRGIDVKIIERENKRLIIYADDNLLDYVKAQVANGILYLTIDDEIRIVSNAHVTIEVPSDGRLNLLRTKAAAEIEATIKIVGKEVTLDASSSGEIQADIIAEECKIKATSSGDIEGEVKCNSCHIDASSSGDVELTVTAQQCTVNASSAADVSLAGAALKCSLDASSAAEIAAARFAVKECRAGASSAADISITCLEKFDGQASSAGDIVVYGEAKEFNRSTSSGGSIYRK